LLGCGLLFSRAAARPKGITQACPLSDFFRPCLITEGAAAPEALSHRLQFLLTLRLMDALDPVPRKSHRPSRQQFGVPVGLLRPPPQRC
jgi:hypothetical protein